MLRDGPSISVYLHQLYTTDLIFLCIKCDGRSSRNIQEEHLLIYPSFPRWILKSRAHLYGTLGTGRLKLEWLISIYNLARALVSNFLQGLSDQ
jgi:hypothetical protein